MSNRSFHDDMGDYLSGRHGEKPKRRKSTKEPVRKKFSYSFRQLKRRIWLLFRKLKSFVRADNRLNLDSLSSDVLVIEKDKDKWQTFKSQLKDFFAQKKQKKVKRKHILKATLSRKKDDIFQRREEKSKAKITSKSSSSQDDIDIAKVEEVMRKNAL